MTPERIAALVGRWVRRYTRGLPAEVAERRVEEIDADLADHIAHERAAGTGDRRIALGILSRMLRGLPADTAWRGGHLAASGGRPARAAVRVACAVACILLVPLVAMLVTDEVAWSPADFALAGALLMATGLALARALRRRGDIAYRSAAGLALAAVLLLVWLIGAVGVIGEDGDPADLMYAGVLAVGLAGAVLARLRPRGMARALIAMAVAQSVVTAIALIAGEHRTPTASVAEIVGLNGLFVALFLGSAALFGRAARPASGREEGRSE